MSKPIIIVHFPYLDYIEPEPFDFKYTMYVSRLSTFANLDKLDETDTNEPSEDIISKVFNEEYPRVCEEQYEFYVLPANRSVRNWLKDNKYNFIFIKPDYSLKEKIEKCLYDHCSDLRIDVSKNIDKYYTGSEVYVSDPIFTMHDTKYYDLIDKIYHCIKKSKLSSNVYYSEKIYDMLFAQLNNISIEKLIELLINIKTSGISDLVLTIKDNNICFVHKDNA